MNTGLGRQGRVARPCTGVRKVFPICNAGGEVLEALADLVVATLGARYVHGSDIEGGGGTNAF
jgi:hypothetical protein